MLGIFWYLVFGIWYFVFGIWFSPRQIMKGKTTYEVPRTYVGTYSIKDLSDALPFGCIHYLNQFWPALLVRWHYLRTEPLRTSLAVFKLIHSFMMHNVEYGVSVPP